jgi:hypothetical protein
MNVCSKPLCMRRAIAATVALVNCMAAPSVQAHLGGGSPPASNIDQIILSQTASPMLSRQQGPSQSQQTAFLDGFFGRTDDVAPTPPTDFFETPRSKPQLKRLKPKHPPLAQPTAPSGDNKAMSFVPPASGEVATALRDPANSSAVAASKAWSLPSAPVTASSQTPKLARKINDLPITPLE